MIKFLPNKQSKISIGTTNLKEQQDYPLKLSYTAVFICLEGEALFNVNFKSYLVKTDDILVLSHGSICVVKQTSPDFRLFYCMIDESFAPEIAYNLPNHLFSYLWEFPLTVLDESVRPLLTMWLEQLQHIAKEPTTHQHIMLRNHLQNFFLEIANGIPKTELKQPKKYSRKEELCWTFWDMVGKYCTEQRNVGFYAKKLSITPYYLSQITQEFFGNSPKELIDRQVLLEMKSLLRSTDLSIKEIAERLNFDDPSYMGRYFRRHTGNSLTEYRR